MDKKEILKALDKVQVAQIRQELDNEKDGVVEEYPAMLADEGGFYLDGCFSPYFLGGILTASNLDQNIFPDEDTAQRYAEAFKVMLELRRCEGAGHYYEEYGNFRGYSIDQNTIDSFDRGCPEMFAFFPPFPTEELAKAAMKKVGKDRIIASLKFLANIKED